MKKYIGGVIAAACLTSAAHAGDFPVSVTGHVYIDVNCNCRIDPGVDVLVDGVNIALQDGTGTVLGVSATGDFPGLPGFYSFPSNSTDAAPNAGDNYTLQMWLPNGFRSSAAVPGPYATAKNGYTLKFNISVMDPQVLNPGQGGATFRNYDFLIKQTCPFETFDQDDWEEALCGKGRRDRGFGERCYRVCPSYFQYSHESNFGTAVQRLLQENWDDLYPQGLTVGSSTPGLFKITLTSPKAVSDFLPRSGISMPLMQNYLNPKSNALGSLAGETVALQLNVDFSAKGITTGLFGSLRVTLAGPLNGMSVRDILALANAVLGADPFYPVPAGVTPSYLASVLAKINSNYDGGRANRHYLSL